MKNSTTMLLAVLCLSIGSVHGQMGRPGGMGASRNGPQITAAMAKLFGQNSAFSADVESQTQMSKDNTVTMPGKIAFDSGKSRFEMNMSDAKGSGMSPQMAAQMKSMGMDSLVTISRPDSKTLVIYPGLQSYIEIPGQDSGTNKSGADFKIQVTELGKETVDGHPCVKNKAVVTDDEGKTHESTVWNATDLKNFPVKIESAEQGVASTMLFKNIKLSKPEASLFETPSGYKKYDDQMQLMQAEVMKRMGGSAMPGGMRPEHP